MAALNVRKGVYFDQENVSQPVIKGSTGLQPGLGSTKSVQNNFTTPRKALGNVGNTGIQRSGAGFKKPLSTIKKQQLSKHGSSREAKIVSRNLGNLTPLQHRTKQHALGRQNFKTDEKKEFSIYCDEQSLPISSSCPSEREQMFPFREAEMEYQQPAYLKKLTQSAASEMFCPPFTLPIVRRSKLVINLDDYPLEDIKPTLSEPSLLDAVAADLQCPEVSNTDEDPVFSLDELDKDLASLELSFRES